MVGRRIRQTKICASEKGLKDSIGGKWLRTSLATARKWLLAYSSMQEVAMVDGRVNICDPRPVADKRWSTVGSEFYRGCCWRLGVTSMTMTSRVTPEDCEMWVWTNLTYTNGLTLAGQEGLNAYCWARTLTLLWGTQAKGSGPWLGPSEVCLKWPIPWHTREWTRCRTWE